MELQINPDLRVRSDALNVFIEVKQTVKKGKNEGEEKWVDQGFFPNFEMAVNDYFDKQLNKSEAKDVIEILSAIKEVREMIKGMNSLINKERQVIDEKD